MSHQSRFLLLAGALVAAAFVFPSPGARAQGEEPAFGGSGDVAFAKELWKSMEGYRDWKLTTPVYEGSSPHGKFVRLWSTWVTVDKRAYPIIIKDNYGGRGVTAERATKDPSKWVNSVTIMLQREEGYDAEGQNWFYVKYGKDGTILKNKKGKLLAGRVARGARRGCMQCHIQAGGNDFLFSNDE